MQSRSKKLRFGGALSSSVALFILVLVTPLPVKLRLLIVLGVALGWSWVVARWSVQRFGRKEFVFIAVIVLLPSALIARAYWLDGPNRRLVAEIEKIPGFHTGCGGGLIAGKVDAVYANSNASDRDIARFTELSGLEDVASLFLNGPRLSDATARKLTRLKSLRYLTLSETGISDDVAEELQRALPFCRIEIR